MVTATASNDDLFIPCSFYSRLEQHYPPELFHAVEVIQCFQCQSTPDGQHSSDRQHSSDVPHSSDRPHSSDVPGLTQEAQAMETDPCSGSSESGEVNEAAVSNATVSLDSSGPIRVESEGAKGGTVAALVGMLFDTSKWSPVVRCVDIPDGYMLWYS